MQNASIIYVFSRAYSKLSLVRIYENARRALVPTKNATTVIDSAETKYGAGTRTIDHTELRYTW